MHGKQRPCKFRLTSRAAKTLKLATGCQSKPAQAGTALRLRTCNRHSACSLPPVNAPWHAPSVRRGLPCVLPCYPARFELRLQATEGKHSERLCNAGSVTVGNRGNRQQSTAFSTGTNGSLSSGKFPQVCPVQACSRLRWRVRVRVRVRLPTRVAHVPKCRQGKHKHDKFMHRLGRLQLASAGNGLGR